MLPWRLVPQPQVFSTVSLVHFAVVASFPWLPLSKLILETVLRDYRLFLSYRNQVLSFQARNGRDAQVF